VKYDKYDSKGNLQQYTTKDGVSTVIIWGYNGTQPIAKIENAKLENIGQSFIDSIVNASNTDAAAERNNDETTLLNAFKTFKDNLSGYQITTYTYDPLIGVRSITPPSGIREVYLYDDAGRLKEIREQNNTGKLLKNSTTITKTNNDEKNTHSHRYAADGPFRPCPGYSGRKLYSIQDLSGLQWNNLNKVFRDCSVF
jgi:hypothetical protein